MKVDCSARFDGIHPAKPGNATLNHNINPNPDHRLPTILIIGSKKAATGLTHLSFPFALVNHEFLNFGWLDTSTPFLS